MMLNARPVNSAVRFLLESVKDATDKNSGSAIIDASRQRRTLRRLGPSLWRRQQSLASDGPIACFSSNLFLRRSNAKRGLQLKAVVGLLRYG
jgi:hypothetical protein